MNEVYKSFNKHQTPLAILDFQIPSGKLGPTMSLFCNSSRQTVQLFPSKTQPEQNDR